MRYRYEVHIVRYATSLLDIVRQYKVYQSVQLLGVRNGQSSRYSYWGPQRAIKGLFAGVSRPALASNQPPVQRVPEVFSSGTAVLTFS
jgi:hypothetical protein